LDAVRAGEEHVGGYIWMNEKYFRPTPVSAHPEF